MWEQLHQKFELRKASGLASWEAVPSSPFELDLGPGFFTSGFGLKGAHNRGPKESPAPLAGLPQCSHRRGANGPAVKTLIYLTHPPGNRYPG